MQFCVTLVTYKFDRFRRDVDAQVFFQIRRASSPLFTDYLLKLKKKSIRVEPSKCMVHITGGPPVTRKSLTRFPLPGFLAYVHAKRGFSR